MRSFRKLLYILLTSTFMAIVPISTVSAAGNVAFTAEGAASAQTGTRFTAVVYVNPSGASFLNGQLTLNLTNLTFQSYSASSGMASSAINGCGVGATTCTLNFYNIAGISTKTAVGTLTINATGAGGTSGQISLSGAAADDTNDSPMAVSTTNRTISISSPPPPATATPNTPPPATATPNTPPPSGGSTATPLPASSSAGSNPNTSNPIDNPDPESTVSVPDENGEVQIISENELSLAVANAETDSETVATDTKKSPISLIIMIVTGIILIALVAVGAKLLLDKIARKRNLNPPIAGAPTDTIFPVDKTPESSEYEKPPIDDNDLSNGPTIITPNQ